MVITDELDTIRSCENCGAARNEDDEETARDNGRLVVRDEVRSERRRTANGETGIELAS